MIGRQATGAIRCTQQTKSWLETSLDGVAEMANATEPQAGRLDPDLSQNGYIQYCRMAFLASINILVIMDCSILFSMSFTVSW